MPRLTAARLHKLLHYDPKNGIFTWRSINGRSKMHVGDVAGVINNRNGHRVIGIDYRMYGASRLAFLYMQGRWPSAEIDHRNCNPSDNRWHNLRPATRSQNSQNTSIQKRKKEKQIPKGVGWHKHLKKYRAYIGLNGRHISLGYFDDPNKAHAAYVNAAKKYFGKFARAR